MTSAGLIETLDNGSENNPSQDCSHPDNEPTLNCITGDVLVSLISGEETNFWD